MTATTTRIPGWMIPPRHPSLVVLHAATMPIGYEQLRQGEHHVGAPREDRVAPAAEEAGEQADDEPDQDGDAGGDDADEQRRARAVHRAHEEVAAGPVGAEPELVVRALRDAELVHHRVGVGRRVRMARDLRGDRAAGDREEDQDARSRPPPASATLSSRKRAQKSCQALLLATCVPACGAQQLGRRGDVSCGCHPTLPRNVRVGPDTRTEV